MKKIIKLTAIASVIMAPTLVQAQATSPMEVSATVIPGCFIEADNINFGTLAMPLSDSIAQSDMRVHCSKGANLSININYSGNTSVSSSNYTVTSTNHYNSVGNFYFVYYKIYVDGKPLSFNTFDFMCSQSRPSNQGGNYVGSGREHIESKELAELYGVEAGYQENLGLCDRSTNSSTGYFSSSLDSIFGTTTGVLSGINKGEQISYFLTKPETNNKWSEAHTLTATGIQQTIPMKANIKRADNPTHRMSPDTYQATLTVVLTY